MAWAALILWIVTALGGFYLLATWLRNGGMQQSDRPGRRIKPPLLLGHFALAATGLVLWIVYVATDNRHADDAARLEDPVHTAHLAKIAGVLIEDVANLGGGPVAIVRHDLHHDGGAAGRVALVGDLVVRGPIGSARRTLDGAINVVHRHVRRAGTLDRHAQTEIRIGVRPATLAHRYDKLTPQTGEKLSTFGIVHALLTSYLMPF